MTSIDTKNFVSLILGKAQLRNQIIYNSDVNKSAKVMTINDFAKANSIESLDNFNLTTYISGLQS